MTEDLHELKLREKTNTEKMNILNQQVKKLQDQLERETVSKERALKELDLLKRKAEEKARDSLNLSTQIAKEFNLLHENVEGEKEEDYNEMVQEVLLLREEVTYLKEQLRLHHAGKTENTLLKENQSLRQSMRQSINPDGISIQGSPNRRIAEIKDESPNKEQLNLQIKKLTTENEDLSDKLDNTIKKLKLLQNLQMDSQVRQINSNNNPIEMATNESAKLKAELMIKKNELEAEKKQNTQFIKQMERINQELVDKLGVENEKLKKEKMDLLNKVNILMEKNIDMNKQLDLNNVYMNNDIKNLKIQTLEGDNLNLRQQLKEGQGANQRMAELEDQVLVLKTRLLDADRDYKDELESLHKEINQLETDKLNAEHHIGRQNQAVTNMDKKIGELELHKKRLTIYLTQFQKKYKQLRNDNKALKAQVKAAPIISANGEMVPNEGNILVTESDSSDWDKYSGLQDGDEVSPGNGKFKSAVQDLVSGLIPSDRTEKEGPIDSSALSPNKEELQKAIQMSHSEIGISDSNLKKKDEAMRVSGINIKHAGRLPPLQGSDSLHMSNKNLQTSGGLINNIGTEKGNFVIHQGKRATSHGYRGGQNSGQNKTTYMVDGKRMNEIEYQTYLNNLKNRQSRQKSGLTSSSATNIQSGVQQTRSRSAPRQYSTEQQSGQNFGGLIQPDYSYGYRTASSGFNKLPGVQITNNYSSNRGLLKRPPLPISTDLYKIQPADYNVQRFGSKQRRVQSYQGAGEQNSEVEVPVIIENRNRTMVETTTNGELDPNRDAHEIVTNAYNTVMHQYGGTNRDRVPNFASVEDSGDMNRTVSSQLTYGTVDGLGYSRRLSGMNIGGAGTNGNFMATMNYSNSTGLNDLISRYNQTKL